MTHSVTVADHAFRSDVAAGRLAPAAFDHRAHIRLAYVCLAGRTVEAALEDTRATIRAFLGHHGVPATKYHETLTHAWLLAVDHFLTRTPESDSADDFIARNPVLLDSRIMLTHYSAERLFSDEARAGFIEPDIEQIPRRNRNRNTGT